MGIKECLVTIFAKLFLNTNLPCNEYIKDIIKTHMRTDCEIVERNDEHIIIVFPFNDMPMTITCTLKMGSNGMKNWVETIILN